MVGLSATATAAEPLARVGSNTGSAAVHAYSADVDLAAHAAVWGAMFNAGQTCVSVERVYVLESVHDQFVDAVVRDVNKLKMGAGDGYDFGSQIDDSQVAAT